MSKTRSHLVEKALLVLILLAFVGILTAQTIDVQALNLTGPGTVTTGNTATYTLRIRNNSTIALSNIYYALRYTTTSSPSNSIAIVDNYYTTSVPANGGLVDVQLSWTLSVAGTFYLWGITQYSGDTNTSSDVYGPVTVTVSGGGGGSNDLAAQTITGPTTLTTGSSGQFTVGILNNGSTTATGYTVQLIQAGTSTVLGSATGTTLTAGSTRTFNISWTPSSTGTFSLQGRVSWSSDSNSSNNTTPGSHSVYVSGGGGGGNDLAAQSITGPNTLTTGSSGSFTIGVANVGSGTASIYTVQLIQAGTSNVLGIANGTSLSAGSSRTHTISWTPSSAGTYSLQGKVIWSSDTNSSNDITSSHTVVVSSGGGGGTNDLAAVSIDGPRQLTLGAQATYEIFIQNLGTTTASGYNVSLSFWDEWSFGSILLSSVSGPSLSSGQSSSVSITWQVNQTGSLPIYGAVDWGADTNSVNNTTPSITVTVTGGGGTSDLAAISVDGPRQLTSGTQSTHEVLIQNMGTTEASGYSVGLYLWDTEYWEYWCINSVYGPALSPGQSSTVSITWQVYGTGSIQIYGGLSWGNDSNQSNNMTPGITVTITDPVPPQEYNFTHTQPSEFVNCWSGWGNGVPFTAAMRFTPAQLASFGVAGKNLVAVEISRPNASFSTVGSYSFKVWIGGSYNPNITGAGKLNPGTLACEQYVGSIEIGYYSRIDFSSPISIPTNQELWVGFDVVTYNTDDYPVIVDQGPLVQGCGFLYYRPNSQYWDLHADAEPTSTGNLVIECIAQNPLSDTDIVFGQTREGLLTNYPNPFNPETTIRFDVLKEGDVSIDIFNVKGQRVRSLVNGSYHRGSHSVVWNGVDDKGNTVGSGVYFYRMRTGDTIQTRRMMLLK